MICTSQLLKNWLTSNATLAKRARVVCPSGFRFSHYFWIKLQYLFTRFSCLVLPYITYLSQWITALPLPTPHLITVSLPVGKDFRFLRQFYPVLIVQENGRVFSTCALFDGYSCQDKTLGSRYSFLFRNRARKLPFLQLVVVIIASISTKGSPLRKGYRPRVHETSYLLPR